jgi:anthranilate phosphoribosyltransferase
VEEIAIVVKRRTARTSAGRKPGSAGRSAKEEQSDLQQGFHGACCQVETPEEVGTFDAREYDTLKVEVKTPALIDNCGTSADGLRPEHQYGGSRHLRFGPVCAGMPLGDLFNCGAIDVIEALGVNVGRCWLPKKSSLEKAGICAWNAFLPKVHPKTLARVLSQIRFGSTINLVGPLLNPTRPAYKVMGVPNQPMIEVEAKTLQALGFKRAFVMHGLKNIPRMTDFNLGPTMWPSSQRTVGSGAIRSPRKNSASGGHVTRISPRAGM